MQFWVASASHRYVTEVHTQCTLVSNPRETTKNVPAGVGICEGQGSTPTS